MTYQFSSDYLNKSLIPALNSAALATELGGNTANISRFSYAGGISTYSFGLYQYDVGNNPAARTLLSQLGFSSNQITMLSQHGGLTASQTSNLNAQLQSALNVPANAVKMQLFNDAWAAGLATQLQTVINTVAGSGAVGQSIASQLYSSTALQVQVLDYANQFHLDVTGLMVSWLEGKSVSLKGGTFKIPAGTQLTSNMIRSFVMGTDQGVLHASSQITRENALFNVLNNIPAGQPATVADTSASPLITDPNMAIVIATPTGCTIVNPDGLRLEPSELAAFQGSCAQSASGAASPQGTPDGTAGSVAAGDGGNLSSAPDNGDPTQGAGTPDPSGGSSGGSTGDSGGSSGGDDGGDDGGDGDGGGVGGGGFPTHPEENSISPGTSANSLKMGSVHTTLVNSSINANRTPQTAFAALPATAERNASLLVQSMASFSPASSISTAGQESWAGSSLGALSLIAANHVTRMAA